MKSTDLYVRQQDGALLHIHEVRAENPNVSIPNGADLTHIGYVQLELTAPPVASEGYEVVQLPPVGNVQQWGFVPVSPPQVITMRQARLALLGAGLLDTISAAIAAMPGVEGAAARIEWEYAAEVQRGSQLVAGMASSLGLTDEQLDALFVTAAKL